MPAARPHPLSWATQFSAPSPSPAAASCLLPAACLDSHIGGNRPRLRCKGVGDVQRTAAKWKESAGTGVNTSCVWRACCHRPRQRQGACAGGCMARQHRGRTKQNASPFHHDITKLAQEVGRAKGRPTGEQAGGRQRCGHACVASCPAHLPAALVLPPARPPSGSRGAPAELAVAPVVVALGAQQALAVRNPRVNVGQICREVRQLQGAGWGRARLLW